MREMGPLWRFSSFPFESAHRELLTSCSGTIKSSRSLAEEFLRRQDRLSSHFEQQRKLGVPLGPAVKKLTKVTAECQMFFKKNTSTNSFSVDIQILKEKLLVPKRIQG